jgi:GAF domain-containing protein
MAHSRSKVPSILPKTRCIGPPATTSSRRDIAELGDLAVSPSIERAVAAVRDFLGMDVAYATEFADGNQVFHHVRGDGDAIGLYEGLVIPLEMTYCQRVVAGELPNVIPDTRAVAGTLPQAADQAANIGAFVSVPITFSDGELYGTLCAASQTAHPDLEPRDLQFLRVFARLIADQIELQRLQDRERERAIEATASECSPV